MSPLPGLQAGWMRQDRLGKSTPLPRPLQANPAPSDGVAPQKGYRRNRQVQAAEPENNHPPPVPVIPPGGLAISSLANTGPVMVAACWRLLPEVG